MEWYYAKNEEFGQYRIRKEPDFQSEVVGFINPGDSFIVTDTKEEWLQIDYENIVGWSVSILNGKQFLIPKDEKIELPNSTELLKRSLDNIRNSQNNLPQWALDLNEFGKSPAEINEIVQKLKHIQIEDKPFYDLEPNVQEHVLNFLVSKVEKTQFEIMPLWANDLIMMFCNDPKQISLLINQLSARDQTEYLNNHLAELPYDFQAKVIDMMSELEEKKIIEYLSFHDLQKRFSPSEDEPKEGLRVAILNCKGCYKGSAKCFEIICNEAIANLKAKDENLQIKIRYCRQVTGGEVGSGCLRFFDVFCVPGGDHEGMMDDIGPNGQLEIRKFIQSGGGYFGVCGGTFLAEWVGVSRIYNIGTNKGLGIHEIGKVSVLDQNLSPFFDSISNDPNSKFAEDKWVFDNGPIIMPISDSIIQKAKSLSNNPNEFEQKFEEITKLAIPTPVAIFVEDLALKVQESVSPDLKDLADLLPVGLMKGACACMESTFGEGKLVLFATHPEQGREKIVLHFLKKIGEFRLSQRLSGFEYGSNYVENEEYRICGDEGIFTTRYGFKSHRTLPLCFKFLIDEFQSTISRHDISSLCKHK